MRKTLHLFTRVLALAPATIERQRRDPGTTVTVALLPGVVTPPLPDDVVVRHVGRDLGYAELLDLIFESDQVITW